MYLFLQQVLIPNFYSNGGKVFPEQISKNMLLMMLATPALLEARALPDSTHELEWPFQLRGGHPNSLVCSGGMWRNREDADHPSTPNGQ